MDSAEAQELDREAVHTALDRVLDARGGDDPSSLVVAMRAVAQVRGAVDGAMVELVPAFEASMAWAADGHRSPVSWMVEHLGVARAAAASERRTCLAASRMPHVAAAARRGQLSSTHLRHLVRARREPVEEVFDDDEEELVEEATAMRADQLKVHLERWWFDALAALGENEPERDPGGTDRSSLRLREGFAGRGLVEGDLAPEAHATLAEAIAAEIERWRREGSLEADPRTWAELQADALVALVARGAATPEGSVRRPSLLAVVDLDTLLRRAGVDAAERTRRRAEICGIGPVSDALIRELASRAGISLLVTGAGGRPLWRGRQVRLASAAQRAAVLAADGGRCYWPGCDAPAHRCQIDHLTGWEQGGATDIDNLGPICGFHNRLKHRGRYQAARGPDGRIEVRDRDGHPIGARAAPADRAPP
ncbi:MAG: DUF222 domain-containing protein [Acidimicrobiales bacterium]|nr:DUF222 domain-containing protein [Acidimicrobiales bacterium]HRW37475.1 DUF222 domain-containing protein [Aquihabitans sp.]